MMRKSSVAEASAVAHCLCIVLQKLQQEPVMIISSSKPAARVTM
jgi:hypothetical protein